MNIDEFDQLVDDATHAVKDVIPENYLSELGNDALMSFLYEINDALTPILRELVQSGEDADEKDNDE